MIQFDPNNARIIAMMDDDAPSRAVSVQPRTPRRTLVRDDPGMRWVEVIVFVVVGLPIIVVVGLLFSFLGL